MSIFVVVSARMASSRCPGKALVPLAGRPLLEVLLDRMAAVRGVDGVVLATSVKAENDPLVEVARRAGFESFRGDEDDVLRRHVDGARALGADHVVRDRRQPPHRRGDDRSPRRAPPPRRADYTYVPGDALSWASWPRSSRAPRSKLGAGSERRHRSELMTLYIKEHHEEFKVVTAALPAGLYRPEYRLTVDEPEDVRLMQEIFSRLATPGRRVTAREAIALLDREPALAHINAHLRHKAANLRSVALDAGIAKA